LLAAGGGDLQAGHLRLAASGEQGIAMDGIVLGIAQVDPERETSYGARVFRQNGQVGK